LKKNGISIKQIETLLSRVSGPIRAKKYLDLKKVDRELTKIEIENSTFVEVGAGLCLDLLYLTGNHKIYGVAVDLSKQSLTTGKLWAKELGVHAQMDFCVADALNMPFRSGQIDLVASYSAVEHLPKKELAKQWINEMSRITRNEGTVVLTTSNMLWPMYALTKLSNKIGIGLIASWRTSELFYHPYEVKAMIENAGLCPVSFNGRGLYYYNVLPFFPLTTYLNLVILKIINVFQIFSSFRIICGRIGFRAIKKSKLHII
jgi:ubiquinone/menaquinone biosynthesis C-methylase UbiE